MSFMWCPHCQKWLVVFVERQGRQHAKYICYKGHLWCGNWNRARVGEPPLTRQRSQHLSYQARKARGYYDKKK